MIVCWSFIIPIFIYKIEKLIVTKVKDVQSSIGNTLFSSIVRDNVEIKLTLDLLVFG